MKTRSANLFVATVALTATVFASSALAESPPEAAPADSREGFTFSLGIGPGFGMVEAPKKEGATETEKFNTFGASVDVTAGWGLSKQLTVYMTLKELWFDNGGTTSMTEIAGVGASYFLSDSAPSVFFNVAAGGAIYTEIGVDGSNTGGGFGLGAGYEFIEHGVVQLDATMGMPGDLTENLVLLKLGYLYY